MITQALAAAVLGEALKTGGDFAELFIEDKDNISLSMLDGKVEEASSGRSWGAGVRVLLGDQYVYAYTNHLDEGGLLSCARKAAAALGELKSTSLPCNAFVPCPVPPYNPIKIYPADTSHARRIDVLRAAHGAAKAVSPEISQVSAGLAQVDQRVLIANSEGLWKTDRRVRTRLRLSAVAGSGTEFQTGLQAPGMSMGFEAFYEKINPEQCGKNAAQTAVTMLHAPQCPSGVVPAVLDGGFGGVIFHEACGHALETSSVSKGNSVFCGKMGQQIAAPCVNALDDGTLPGEWGTIQMDDEGHDGQSNLLIEKGILKSYMVDKIGARRMGLPETGNGRRQNYTYAPTARMTNTFIAPGKDDPDSMLRTMGDGLYAKEMGGGSVNPLTGEFNFAVTEGYLVRDGKIVSPVRGATLIGKGAEVIMDIDRVGPGVTLGTGMCGAASGSVPTSVGQPRIRVAKITVGGKGGAF